MIKTQTLRSGIENRSGLGEGPRALRPREKGEKQKEVMSDQIDRQKWHREHLVSAEQIVALVNKVQGTLKNGDQPRLTGAVVFAFGKEFAFVTNQKDAMKLLEYGDPVGVVGIGGLGRTKPQFISFSGHEWANKHAKTIINQAENVVDAYVWC